MFRFPANPFAGAKLPGARLPVPKLPSLARLPKPNFGNIANAVRTPAQQAISSSVSASAPAVASAKRQPPPAPNRKFDSTSTDEKLAKSLQSKGSNTKSDFSVAKGDANAELTPAQKRFKNALSEQQAKNRDVAAKTNPNAGLWSDYRPDSTPSSSNNLSANQIEDLAKVNRGLYDQYGKLTTGNSSPKLSEPFDPKLFAAKAKESAAEKTDQSIAGLKSQLEKMKARGAGTSDEFSVPSRSAIEIAGTAPRTLANKAEISLHKGFGDSDKFKPAVSLANSGTVNIPDPTAPANVLRASANQIPGLVQATNVAGPGKYSSTNLGGYAANNIKPSDLPTGGSLPENTEDLVENEFVKQKQQHEIPTLSATAKPESPLEMPLPREVSDASLAALAENARAAEAAPQPKITFQNPIQQKSIQMPQQSAPVVLGSPSMPPATTVADTTAVSAFNLPATRSPRVTKNQFFGSPMQAAAPLKTPAASGDRVAEVQQAFSSQSIMSNSNSATTALPEGITTGESSYAPGSVVKPQAESRWR